MKCLKCGHQMTGNETPISSEMVTVSGKETIQITAYCIECNRTLWRCDVQRNVYLTTRHGARRGSLPRPGTNLINTTMDNKKFWWLLTVSALLITFLYLISRMRDDRQRIDRIENHSEITQLDAI
jgi:hypothetical protein